jgi:hypothetical protein
VSYVSEREGLRSDLGAALLLAAALGCAHAGAPRAGPTADLGERFTLRPGESAAIGRTPAEITFERILSDNRCAVDVVCIQAGEARAWFRLDAEQGHADTFTLDTDRNATAVVSGYRISLLSVSPAPRSAVRIDPRNYTVELTVALARS